MQQASHHCSLTRTASLHNQHRYSARRRHICNAGTPPSRFLCTPTQPQQLEGINIMMLIRTTKPASGMEHRPRGWLRLLSTPWATTVNVQRLDRLFLEAAKAFHREAAACAAHAYNVNTVHCTAPSSVLISDPSKPSAAAAYSSCARSPPLLRHWLCQPGPCR